MPDRPRWHNGLTEPPFAADELEFGSAAHGMQTRKGRYLTGREILDLAWRLGYRLVKPVPRSGRLPTL